MKNLLTFYFALKDLRTPWYAKLTALLSLIYLVSPADLLPDVIPFAGYIDDLVVVPFLLNISYKLLPTDVRLAAQQQAGRKNRQLFWLKLGLIAGLILLLAILFYLSYLVYGYLKTVM